MAFDGHFDPFEALAFDDVNAAFDEWRAEVEGRRQAMLADEARANAEAVRARCSTLVGFVREAWKVLEPTQELKIGWALEAIAEHLEAVTFGDLTRLIVNVPPGFMKSLLTGVFWPAWEWGPQGKPGLRIIGAAHKLDLATRDSRKMKTLVESEWFQALWGDQVKPSAKWGEAYIENDRMGWRQSVAFDSLTGGRADRVIIDDPLSTEKAESEADRTTAERITKESLPTRVNDPDLSAIVITMQRLHEKDPAGILQGMPEQGYTVLCLPMRFEPARRCVTRRKDGTVLFVDPRTVDGELLHPERFSDEVVTKLEGSLGSYGTAGQLQQRPSPREGALFKVGLIGRVRAIPLRASKRVRGWDIASTEKKAGTDPDWTAGVRVSKDGAGIFYIEAAVRDRTTPAGVEVLMRATASQDALLGHVSHRLPVDPGSGGKFQVKALTRALAGYHSILIPPTGSKVARAAPLSAQVEAGNVVIVETGDPVRDAWIEPFVEELKTFPAGKHDDQVDAAADAFNECADVIAGEGLMEWYRRQAEAALRGQDPNKPEAEGDGLTALIMPAGGGTYFGIEGDKYQPDAEGNVRVKACDVVVMTRHGGQIVETEDDGQA